MHQDQQRPHPSAPTSKIQHHFSHHGQHNSALTARINKSELAPACFDDFNICIYETRVFIARGMYCGRESRIACLVVDVTWQKMTCVDACFMVWCEHLPWTPIFLHCRWSKRPSTMEVESSLGRKLYTSDCTVIFLLQSALLTVLEDGKSREIQILQKLINWAFQMKARKLWQKEGQHHSPSLPRVSAKFIFFYLFIYLFLVVISFLYYWKKLKKSEKWQ